MALGCMMRMLVESTEGMGDVGVFTVPIRISAVDGQISRRFDALADTGANFTSVPASVLQELGVTRGQGSKFVSDDGESRELFMGEATVWLGDEFAQTKVIFAEEDSPVVLGKLTLTALFMEVDSSGEKLTGLTVYMPMGYAVSELKVSVKDGRRVETWEPLDPPMKLGTVKAKLTRIAKL